MDKTIIAIIGGFLGSGKTTVILELAKRYIKDGYRVGIVTNDQGSQLVDKEYLISQGLDVLSVEGGCFCCRFSDLIDKVVEHGKKSVADILLLEPVGSCTDLVSTVFRPFLNNRNKMLNVFNDKFRLAPLAVLADPKRVKLLMKCDEDPAFNTEVTYLFSKQLEEANIILLNKCDTITDEEKDLLIRYLSKKYKGVEVRGISASAGTELEGLQDTMLMQTFSDRCRIDVDYSIYGAAEAKLGWFNTGIFVQFEKPADFNLLMRRYMDDVRKEFIEKGCSIAHMKCYAVAEGDHFKASITDNFEDICVNSTMACDHCEANIIINARVISDAGLLKCICEKHILGIFGVDNMDTNCFSPGFPKPSYRE
jgi:hypothetical protein